MVRVEDLITLRRLTYAVMLHRGITRRQAVQAIEDLLWANSFDIATYAIDGDNTSMIEPEARPDVCAEFWNEHGCDYDETTPDISHWIEVDRFEQKHIDHVGIERSVAMRAALFTSLDELDKFIQLGESEMRKALLLTAYDAVQYLVDELQDESRKSREPLYDSGLLKIAIDVQKEYWSRVIDTPKQETMIIEIREKYGLSEAEAKAVERIACPVDRARRPSSILP